MNFHHRTIEILLLPLNNDSLELCRLMKRKRGIEPVQGVPLSRRQMPRHDVLARSLRASVPARGLAAKEPGGSIHPNVLLRPRRRSNRLNLLWARRGSERNSAVVIHHRARAACISPGGRW